MVRPSRSSRPGPIPCPVTVLLDHPKPVDDDSFAVTISVAQVEYTRRRGTIHIADRADAAADRRSDEWRGPAGADLFWRGRRFPGPGSLAAVRTVRAP